MQSPDSYAVSDRMRLLLQGPPGSGKDVVAAQFPKPFVIDIDRNLGNVMRFLDSRNLPKPKFDFVDTDARGVTIPHNKAIASSMAARYDRLGELLVEAQLDPTVETLVVSSGTTLVDIMIGAVLRQQGKQNISDFKDGRQFWNFFAIAGRHFMATLSEMQKHIVFTVHEKNLTNEEGQVISTQVAWPGQVGEIIGCFFTQNWRCETEAPANKPVKYLVRTAPTHRHALKQALVGIPDVFEFKWEMVERCLKGGGK